MIKMSETKQKQTFGILATLAGVILVALVGYYIFINYMTVFVPNLASYSLLLIAVVAGIAAFFNPCNFAVLPAYLSYYYSLTEKADKSKNKFKTILLYGIVAALGIVTFNLILGSLIGLLGAGFGKSFALKGDAPNQLVRIFRGIVGAIILALGLIHISKIELNLSWLNAISNKFSLKKSKNI